MVSTRGPRYKFSEGERVLCYEPDPTKAKVLYDSKVLEVIEAKDKRGRRSVEYLIHFQGWNSSWDRCVSEDFVLKDTEDNRQLQRQLADKSQLQLGAYLYRRDRKKVPATAGATVKRTRASGCEGDSSGSSPPAPVEEGAPSDCSASGSSSESGGEQRRTTELPSPCSATIPLGPGLRDRLTFDYHLVMKRSRLTTLPVKPNVLDILEACVQSHVTRVTTAAPQARRARNAPAPDPTQEARKLTLMRQVADGLRIYFDFILRDQLLYPPEDAQFQAALDSRLFRDPRATPKEEDTKGPEEYSHLPPSPSPCEASARRLRSHKSPCTAPSEPPEEQQPPGPSSTVGSAGSPGTSDSASTAEVSGVSAELLQHALSWRIVPPDQPPYPTAVYGATHLSRLFVKLPEYLSVIIMPEAKLKLIIEYIEIFVQFLEEHEEWFGESFYHSTDPTAS